MKNGIAESWNSEECNVESMVDIKLFEQIQH